MGGWRHSRSGRRSGRRDRGVVVGGPGSGGRRIGCGCSLLLCRRRARGSVRVMLACSRLAGRMALRWSMARGWRVGCGVARRLRVAHSRSLGCSHSCLLVIRATWWVLGSFEGWRSCLPWMCLSRCRCGSACPSPCHPVFQAQAVPRLRCVCRGRLPSSAWQGAHPHWQAYWGCQMSRIVASLGHGHRWALERMTGQHASDTAGSTVQVARQHAPGRRGSCYKDSQREGSAHKEDT